MPPKKVAKRSKAAPTADRKHSYLPRDLQRAAQHMDRAAFLRQLQRAQSDRQHSHVASQTGSDLSSTGAVDLAKKIDLVRSELTTAIGQMGDNFGRNVSDVRTDLGRDMRTLAGRRAASDAPRRRPGIFGQRRAPEVELMGGHTMGGSTGSSAT